MNIVKYSANGNDFIIFHTFIDSDRSDIAKKLCDRFFGIGADGLIVLLPSQKHDFVWQFYNSDGSVASMCGNASRVAAHYAYKNALCDSNCSFLTGSGVINAKVDGIVVESELTAPVVIKKSWQEESLTWSIIDTGVPHLVSLVDSVDMFDKKMAKTLRDKYNANVNFAEVDNGSIKIRTFERGVEDETLACGTGMAAAFFVANSLNLVDIKAYVYPLSKDEIELKLNNQKISIKGKITELFSTNIDLKS
jgi:diaminopimelate epimerase